MYSPVFQWIVLSIDSMGLLWTVLDFRGEHLKSIYNTTYVLTVLGFYGQYWASIDNTMYLYRALGINGHS